MKQSHRAFSYRLVKVSCHTEVRSTSSGFSLQPETDGTDFWVLWVRHLAEL